MTTDARHEIYSTEVMMPSAYLNALSEERNHKILFSQICTLYDENEKLAKQRDYYHDAWKEAMKENQRLRYGIDASSEAQWMRGADRARRD